jgi:GrpB-like predicted nucleotidyltransferase (UPF0157 family)
MESQEKKIDTSHLEIQEYNPVWALKYESEAQKIKEVIGEKIIQIEHIGSTSIPGLCSKPIIDIAILISSYKDADDLIKPLELLGYDFDLSVHQSQSNPERHFFRKGSPTEFHLSIAYDDKASFWERQILFRDYLREHKDMKDMYAELKKILLMEDPTGRDVYVMGKTDFVMTVLKKAGFQNKYFDLSKY